MRLDKFLSNLKYGSRNDIKSMCKGGNVRINGSIVKDSSTKIDPDQDIVSINGEEITYQKFIYIMLNKPQGYVSANKDNVYKTVIELLDDDLKRYDLNIAGRLDVDTTGLVILTNDGQFVHKIIHPNKDIYKEYLVDILRPINEEDIKKLEDGLIVKDKVDNEFMTKKAIVEVIDENKISLKIKEGKFHQVKRMLQAVNNEVVNLHRVAIGNYKLPTNLGLGEYTEFKP